MTETAHSEATVVLRDGSTVAVRPILASDEPELALFFSSLSLESRVFRFFAAVANANASAKAMANVDSKSRSGLVALAGTPARIVGHAMYAEMEPKRAEVAFAVADPYQGRGLGTILLGQVAELAAGAGFDVLEAVVKPENHRMLDVLRKSGFPVHARSEPARSTQSCRLVSHWKPSSTLRIVSGSRQSPLSAMCSPHARWR